jgi:hypothetical protein
MPTRSFRLPGSLSLFAALALVLTLFGAPAAASANTSVTNCTEANLAAAVAAGGVVTLDCDGTTIFLNATLDITVNTTLVGVGAVALDGNDTVRVVQVEPGVTATIRNLTLQHGYNADRGAGVHNDGTLSVVDSLILSNTAGTGGGVSNNGTMTLTNSTVDINHANSGSGGGIRNNGTMTVTSSEVAGNEANQGGGGIINQGALTVQRSIVGGNDADNGTGGGLHNFDTGNATVINTTFYNNSSSGGGAGLANRGTLTVVNSTISGNTASNQAGAIRNANNGVVNVANSILVGNSGDAECSGKPDVTSGGHNIVDDYSCNLGNTGDQEGVLAADVNLGDPASNGGPTPTMLPGPGSIAIDAGDNSICAGKPVNNVDQRGLPRPVGASCDVGSVEVGAEASQLRAIVVTRMACGSASATGVCLSWLVGITVGGHAVAGVEVAATLTLPDGSQQPLSATTDRSGVARFVTPVNVYGTYTLSVTSASYVGIDLAPSGSNSRSIAIGAHFGR